MTHKYWSRIFSDCKLIVEYLQGTITWNDVIEMKETEVKLPDYNPNYNVITDIRDIKINIDNLEGIKQYLDYFRNNPKAVGYRKIAIMTDNSEQVIHSELLRLDASDLPMMIKTVSTYKAAFEWTRLTAMNWHKIADYMEGLRKCARMETKSV